MYEDILPIVLRPLSILGTTYDASPVVMGSVGFTPPPGLYNQLVIYHKFVKGSLTSADLKIEFSPDGVDWYQETSSSISSGVDTLSPLSHNVAADGNYRYLCPIKDAYIRVSVKGNGTVTGSSSQILGNFGRV